MRQAIPIICAGLVAALLLAPCSAAGAEFRLSPSITVRQEYTDNLFLTEKAKVREYITRFLPSIELGYSAPLWTWDGRYTFDYLYYARNKRSSETLHHLTLGGLIEPVAGKLFIRVSEDYGRVSLDVTRELTRESSFVEQSDRNVLIVNPYYVFKLSPQLDLTTGYTFSDTWYEDTRAIDKTEHSLYAEAAYALSPKTAFIGGYRFTRQNSDADDYDLHEVYVGPRYEYAAGSFIEARVGNSWISFKDRASSGHLYWSAGITHAFPTFTAFIDGGVDYSEDPLGSVRRVTRYLAGVRHSRGLTSMSVAFGFTSYRDADSRARGGRLVLGSGSDTDKYGVTGAFKHALTPKLTGSVDLTYERIERKDFNTHTNRFLGGVRFDYLVLEKTIAALSYYYLDSSSPRLVGDRYESNRVFLELTQRF